MGWPKQGVYFFFEEGQTCQGSNDLRVVRVGTHVLKNGSSTTLWDRLRQHRGNLEGNLPVAAITSVQSSGFMWGQLL